jgi:hypothetical protein
MDKTTIYCPFCKDEFEYERWESGECPCCDEAFYWTEFCNEDFTDCWDEILWEAWDR